MAARIIAFALGGLFCHQMARLPDPMYAGLLPLMLPAVLAGGRALGIPAAFLLGVGWSALVAHQGLATRLPEALHGVDLAVSGQVVQVPRRDGDRIRFILELDSVATLPRGVTWDWRGCRLHLTWYRPPSGTRVRAHERWRAGVRLKIPRGARNRGGFDWEHRALREGICATGYLRSSPGPQRLEAGRPGVHRLREHLAGRLAHHLADLPAAGLVRALGVGLRDRVRPEQQWLLQSTGTAHLMAISGLHVGLAAAAGLALTALILGPFPAVLMVLPRAHWNAVGALLAAAGYAALAGFSIPTQRALFMLAAFLAMALARRRCARILPLALALGVLLAVDPLAVFDPATWLSFAAVAGLLWALAPLPREGRSRVSRWLGSMTRLQVVASTVIIPVTVLCFSYQSAAAPLANLVAVPVTGFVAVPAILAGMLADLVYPALGGTLLRFAAHVMGVLLEVLRGLPAREALLVPAASPSALAFASALVGVALLVSVTSPWLRLVGLAWLAPLALPPPAGPGPGALQLRVLDVGQGLASIVRTHRRVLVFDAGPSWGRGRDAGAGIVAPALRHDGVDHVDILMISHHHADHAGGARGLARTMVLGQVMGEGASPVRSAVPCVRGAAWQWDGYLFRVLHPPGPGARAKGARAKGARGNDTSCVLHVSGPAGSVLLPADVEAGGESSLVRRYGAGLSSQVMVVPHHGSRTSSTAAFLDAAAPRVAINSSGHRNRFRLPAPEVVARYRERGVRLLDTACHGEVVVDLVPGRAPVIRAWSGGELRFWHTRTGGAHCGP